MGNNNNQKKTKRIRKMLRTATTIFAIIMAASASARRLDTDGTGQSGNTECADGWIYENGNCCNPKDPMPGSTCGRKLQGSFLTKEAKMANSSSLLNLTMLLTATA